MEDASVKKRTVSVIKTMIFFKRHHSQLSDLPTQARLSLAIPYNQRGPEQREFIERMMSRYSFFQGLKQQYGVQMFQQFCEKLFLKTYDKNQEIIHVAQDGDTFYVIMTGLVSVNIYQPLTASAKHNQKHLHGEVENPNMFVQVEVSRLGPGDSFGELALLESGVKTTATIIAKDYCELVCLTRQHYWDTLGKHRLNELTEKLNYMRSLSFLHGWYEQDLKTISYLFNPLKLKKGQIIFRRGEVAKGIYFLKRGNIELRGCIKQQPKPRFDDCDDIFLDKQDTKGEKDVLVSVLTEGSLFGEEEIMGQTVRNYTAVVSSLYAEMFKTPHADLDRRLWYANSRMLLRKMAEQCHSFRKKLQDDLETRLFLKDRIKPLDLEEIEHLNRQKERKQIWGSMTLRPPSPESVLMSRLSVHQQQENQTSQGIVIPKILSTRVANQPKVDFFMATHDLEKSFSELPSLKVKNQSQSQPLPKMKLNSFQQAYLLGLKPKKQTDLALRMAERAKQEQFMNQLGRIREKTFKDPRRSQVLKHCDQSQNKNSHQQTDSTASVSTRGQSLQNIQHVRKNCVPSKRHSRQTSRFILEKLA